MAVTFKTADGSFVVKHAKTRVSHELTVTCRIKYLTTAAYTVVGSQSTGKFAGANGSGTLTITLQGNQPRLSDGQCQTVSIRPTQNSAVITFHASGPLTVGK